MKWDFSKLPPEQKLKAREAFYANDFYELLKIHNTYKLSEYNYCCGDIATPMYNYYKYAIQNDLI